MRYLEPYICDDLRRKMVFMGGPRQVGKTTLSEDILEKFPGKYFNWDDDDDRRDLLSKKWHDSEELIVFDEIHKFRRWKNWVKGVYDKQKKSHKFLVTGSARLDIYRKGGDSLLGRYHYWRLHPFTLDELPPGISREEAFSRLMSVGGFPEMFLEANLIESKRWRRERLDRLIHEDVRELESLNSLSDLRLLIDLLRDRVGGMVVFSNLAQDLQVSSQTVKHWISVLENMYLFFPVKPYTTKLPRAIQKPPKIFFFDNADTRDDEGVRFENLVATHLLKRLNFLEDRFGDRYELRYLRDKEGREIDFVIVKNDQIEELIEVKWQDEKIGRSLNYYHKKLNPPKSTQIVAHLENSYSKDGINVVSVFDYFGDKVW